MCTGLAERSFAVRRVTLQRTHHRRHLRWLRWNPMFRPSHESLLLQNAEVDRLNLPRIQDETELEALKADGSLLEILQGESLRIDPRLDPTRRYCRRWTLDFVDDLSAAYFNRFHQQIQVNSAVRTVKVQKKLRRHNRNAAPWDGDTASSHLAGVTVDLQRRGMSKEQIRWMEHYLFYMKAQDLWNPKRRGGNGCSTSWSADITRNGARPRRLCRSTGPTRTSLRLKLRWTAERNSFEFLFEVLPLAATSSSHKSFTLPF